MIGQTVGKYRILDRLGRGGMGTVYKAIDETLDREVAIKVLNPDLTDADVLKRFRAEAVTLARLNHPGIATIYELHRHGDELLMVYADIHLAGGMSGLEFARLAKQRYPDVHVVVASGDLSPKLPPGATFMLKPWRPLDLLREAERSRRP